MMKLALKSTKAFDRKIIHKIDVGEDAYHKPNEVNEFQATRRLMM